MRMVRKTIELPIILLRFSSTIIKRATIDSATVAQTRPRAEKIGDTDHDRRTECAPSQSTAAASSGKVDNSPRDVEATSGIIAAGAAYQISLNSDCCSERSEPQATLRTNARPPYEEKPIVPYDRTTTAGQYAAPQTIASGDDILRDVAPCVAGCSIRFVIY
jgi:hypothetical protein